MKNFWKIFKKNVKNGSSLRVFFFHFFAFFCILFELNCKMQKMPKMAFFCHFSHFFENVYSAYTPVFFAVKGGSHPGKNPPIYTVLNAAFSCVKTSVEGHSARLVHDPAERQIFFQKNIFYSPEKFCPHKI